MTETPRPDPWAQVRTFDVSTYGDCRMERDYYGDITSEQTHQRGEYAWVDEVDAARAADVAEIATLRATVDQQAETICQLQATLPELHDAIERQSAQIAALTQERDEEARAFKRAAKDRDICRQKRVDLEARCATLTAALEELYATVKGECPSLLNEDSGGSAQLDAQVSAALAAAPQGGSTK